MHPSSTKTPKLCSICSDNALSCNFGAVTCESCKAFFRRNAHKDEILDECQNKCTMTRETRSFCKSCRLQKCFEMGMNKSLIWTDEDKQKRKRIIEENRYKKKVSDESSSQLEKLNKLADLNSFQGAFINSLKKGTKSRLKMGKIVKSSSFPNDSNSGTSENTTPISLSPAGFSEIMNQRDDDGTMDKSILDSGNSNSTPMESSGDDHNNFQDATQNMDIYSERNKSILAELSSQAKNECTLNSYLSISDDSKDHRLPTIDTIIKHTSPQKEVLTSNSLDTKSSSSFSSYYDSEFSNDMLAHLSESLPNFQDKSFAHTSKNKADGFVANNEINSVIELQAQHGCVFNQETEIQKELHSFHKQDQPIYNSNSEMMFTNSEAKYDVVSGITGNATTDQDNHMHQSVVKNNAYNAMPNNITPQPDSNYMAHSAHVQFNDENVFQDTQNASHMHATISEFAENDKMVYASSVSSTASVGDVRSIFNDNANINEQTNGMNSFTLNQEIKTQPLNDNFLHTNPVENQLVTSDLTPYHSALYSQSVPDYVMKQIDWTLHKHLCELMHACELSFDKAIVETIRQEPDISESFNQLEGFIKKSVVFAKNLQGFCSLPQSDQVALVKGSFIELMCVLFFKIFNPDRKSFYVRHRLAENPEQVIVTETKVGSALGVVEEGNQLMEGYVILWRQFNKFASNDPAIIMFLMAHILFMKRDNFTYKNVEHISYYSDLYCNILKEYIKAAYPRGEVNFLDILAMVPKIIKNCSITQKTLDKASLENLSLFTMNIFDK